MKRLAIILLVLIFLINIGVGIANSLLGAAWPAISLDLSIPISYQSAIIITFFIGTTIGATYAQRIIARLLTFMPIILGGVLIGLTLFVFSISKSFILMSLIAAFTGLGVGFIQATINGYVTKHYNTSAINWLHGFFGIGCSLAPVLLAYYIGVHNSWAMGYQVTAIIEIALVVLLIISYPLWKIHGTVIPRLSATSRSDDDKVSIVNAKSIKELFVSKGTKGVVLLMFVYASFESVIVFWTTSYLVVVKDLVEASAAGMMVYFYGGQVLGRVISGFIVLKISDTKLIRLCQIITFILVVLLFFAPSSMFALIFGLIGIAAGPIFPNLVHEAPSIVGKENAQGVIGLQIAAAYVSSIVMPLVFSIFTRGFGFEIYPIFLVILLIASFLLKLLLDRRRNSGVLKQ